MSDENGRPVRSFPGKCVKYDNSSISDKRLNGTRNFPGKCVKYDKLNEEDRLNDTMVEELDEHEEDSDVDSDTNKNNENTTKTSSDSQKTSMTEYITLNPIKTKKSISKQSWLLSHIKM